LWLVPLSSSLSSSLAPSLVLSLVLSVSCVELQSV
jgi:hypothetical protein